MEQNRCFWGEKNGSQRTGSCHVLRIKFIALALNFTFTFTELWYWEFLQFSFQFHLIVIKGVSEECACDFLSFYFSCVKGIRESSVGSTPSSCCSVRSDLSLIVELLTLNFSVSYVEVLGVGFIRIPKRVGVCQHVMTQALSGHLITTDRCNISFSFLSIHVFPQYLFSFEHGSGTRKLYF